MKNLTQEQLENRQELFYKIIDAIVDLQDAGLGDSKLSELQDYANSKVGEIFTEIGKLN